MTCLPSATCSAASPWNPPPAPGPLAFFEQLRTWMRAFPPSPVDQAYQQRFRPLGLLDPDPPYAQCPEPLDPLAARGGPWGNHGYEAAYPMTYTDADGDPLDGRNHYPLRFTQPPPVDAFWSITMYDLPDFYLVANPQHRYSIGDRTPGLRREPDGSVTIVIQHERPDNTSNWLPAPAAPFRPILRLYQPKAAVLDGSYQIPPVRKAA